MFFSQTAERAVRLQPVFVLFSAKYGTFKDKESATYRFAKACVQITPHVTSLELFCTMLSPVHGLTLLAQAQSVPTAGLVVPSVHLLIKTLKSESDRVDVPPTGQARWPPGLREGLVAMLRGLEKRWGSVDLQPTELIAASIIDPRFKDLKGMR